MAKITVGLFNDSFPPMTDGVGMVVDNYARRLKKYCNVVVFVPGYHQKTDDSKYPYKVVRCKSMRVPALDYSLPLPLLDWKFQKEVREAHLDLIHIHSPFTIGDFGVGYGLRHQIPIIGTMHSQTKQDFERAIPNKRIAKKLNQDVVRIYDKCTKTFAVNSGMARLYHDDYGVKCLPKVLPNATEMKYIEDKEKRMEKINKKYGISPEDKVFLFVGRINRLKNIFFIVDSLAYLNQKELKYSYKMLFVGDGQDFHELERYIHKKKMEKNIILCGNVKNREELIDYYVRSDLFLFPSLYDASSIVQIEAASQKVPTVFLKGSMTSSDIKDRVNGFIANDVKDFASTINEAMTNPDLYQKVSEGCYRDIYRDWDQVVKEVFQMYESIIEKR